MFRSSLPTVVCRRTHAISVCMRIVVSNTYCVVFGLFSSCVSRVAKNKGVANKTFVFPFYDKTINYSSKCFKGLIIIDGDGSRDILDILLTEFSTVLTTILPVLSEYCYKCCYSDN